jgi:site-specific DNA-methyltransferase (adenine-specific)
VTEKGSHFATFPEELARRCIAAGASERGCCPECGAPWVRVVEASGGTIGQAWHDHSNDLQRGHRDATGGKSTDGTYRRATTGWRPTCAHDREPVPCTVLDPFAGSGTTLAVARRMGRRSIGIELQPDYLPLIQRRVTEAALPLLDEPAQPKPTAHQIDLEELLT